MRSGNGRHRRPRQAPAIVVAAGVTGSAIAIPLLGAAGAHAADASIWDRVAECESGGMWSADLGNGFYGGLQFSQETWQDFGGTAYAPARRPRQPLPADRGRREGPRRAGPAGVAQLCGDRRARRTTAPRPASTRATVPSPTRRRAPRPTTRRTRRAPVRRPERVRQAAGEPVRRAVRASRPAGRRRRARRRPTSGSPELGDASGASGADSGERQAPRRAGPRGETEPGKTDNDARSGPSCLAR